MVIGYDLLCTNKLVMERMFRNFEPVDVKLKNPGKTLEKCFITKYLEKPLEFLYYPWKTLENINDTKDSVRCSRR
jgi:hypothetical protein